MAYGNLNRITVQCIVYTSCPTRWLRAQCIMGNLMHGKRSIAATTAPKAEITLFWHPIRFFLSLT